MSRVSEAQYPRVLDLAKPKSCVPVKCGRCGGQGGWTGWPGFTCFRCGGNGVDPTACRMGYPPAWTDEQCAEFEAERDRKAQARREAAQAKRDAAAQAIWHANLAACPELALSIGNDALPEFALDIARKARQFPLSDKQRAAYVRVLAESTARAQAEAERVATAQPCPSGRATVEGEVVMVRLYDGTNFATGRPESTLKMLVLDDRGFKVFVTVPSKLVVDRGDRVRFDCELTPADDDPLFGKGKRPTKAVNLTPEPEPEPENPNGCVGGTCGPVGTWSCSKHGAEYQNRYGRAANE